MCFSSRCYCGTRAESRQNHGGVTCGHGDPIELPLRFDGGATAIIGGSTAGPVRRHCGAGGATAVALRQQGGSMTSARRLDKGGGFRSNSLQFSLLLGAEDVATVITVIATIISDAAETCYKRSGESHKDDTYSNTTRC